MKKMIILIMILLTYTQAQTVNIGELMWQDNNAVKKNKMSWIQAKEYCHDFNLGGFDDWRLPTIKELQSITDISRYNPAIKRNFFKVAPNNYWSSNEDVSDNKLAWSLWFKAGHTYSNNKTHAFYVRCVRDRQ